MNYFAHGWRFTDDPYFLAGTAVPDWLCAADRGVRVRSKQAMIRIEDSDSATAAIARGICQHHADDRWFHDSRAFVELSLDFSARIRQALPGEEGLRSWFLGHILVEILLDAALIEEDPERLKNYYAALDDIEPVVVEATVNRIASRRAKQLTQFIGLFRRERFLWDYAQDEKLCARLNQVMRRVGLPSLLPSFAELLPEMREAVRQRKSELLGEDYATKAPAILES